MNDKRQLPPGYAVTKGYWIVGSLKGTTFSVSANPAQHGTEAAARQEAERLAGLDTSKKFVVLEVKGIVAVAARIWE